MATSHAPAGQVYRNVEHAGECILRDNADNFLNSDSSCMIPPMFKTQYPEPIDEKTGEVLKTDRPLTKKEENRFTGLTNNARGDEAEYAVFKVLSKLVKCVQSPPVYVIRNYVLQNLKANVLASELGINFADIHTVAEFDAVILVKDTRLVLVEVKRKLTEEQQAKAEEQLQNGKLFFEKIMNHITSSTSSLPVVKVIIFPEESSPSSATKSDRDTYVIHKDILSNFNQKWEEMKGDLYASQPSSNSTSHDFRRFVHLVTGVWCMEKYQKGFYKYNTHEATLPCQLQRNDDMINRGIFTSDARTAKNESKIASPVTDVELCRPQDGFPTVAGVDLIYLTPEQMNLYKNVPQAIIRGPAGSGKTLLFNLKIIDILQNHPNKNILIIAPDPHHLRMAQFVKMNGGEAAVTETFPPPVSSGVVIMNSADFFLVSRETLQSYDLCKFHIFIDDMQNLQQGAKTYESGEMDKFDELEGMDKLDKMHEMEKRVEVEIASNVTDFIKRLDTNMPEDDQVLWCAGDEGQARSFEHSEYFFNCLFDVNKTAPQKLAMPICVLTKVLRNSVEISAVVQKVRELRVADRNASSHVLTTSTTGHRIRSETITYHKLAEGTTEYCLLIGDRWKHGKSFAVERVKEELMSLLSNLQHTMRLSDIVVLCDTSVSIGAIRSMLSTTFNITPQTIKDFTVTSNDEIIVDIDINVASFECACVLYLCSSYQTDFYSNYNTMSRARTKLIVIQVDAKKEPPLLTDDVIITKWKESNGIFSRLEE